MLDKILVPLDGSELSDRIVSQLRRLLVRTDAHVTLVEVLPAAAKDVPDQLREAAQRHLDRVATPLREGGATVEAKVLVGDPAERILIEALEARPALIAMATHGRTGIQRWTRGSVAERVLRGARAPLLLANPFALAPGDVRFKRILVPLDGSSTAAEVLPLVRDLATLYDATVILHYTIEVVGAAEGAMPITMTEAEAKTILEGFAGELRGVKIELSASVGYPASSILDAADGAKVDLVAMTSHGRSGLSRWLFGSVAEHVLRHAKVPLLVKRTAGFEPPQATE